MRHLLLSAALLICIQGWSQKSIYEKDHVIKNKTIYLSLIDKNLEYFSSRADSKEALVKKNIFSLQKGYSNIYMQWLNPLRYDLKWKDSVYTDERVQAVNDFVSRLAGQFGLPAQQGSANLNKSLEALADDAREKAEKNAAERKAKEKKRKSGELPDTLVRVPLYNPVDGFNDPALMELYLHLIALQPLFTGNETEQVNKVLVLCDSIDSKNSLDLKKQVRDVILSLYGINSYDKISSVTQAAATDTLIIRNILNATQVHLDDLSSQLKALNLGTAPVMQTYMNVILSDFSRRISENRKKNEGWYIKLNPLFVKIAGSAELSKVSFEFPGYYRIRYISLEDGKMMKTEITITESELNTESLEFIKKTDLYKSEIIFREYDFIVPIVSSGIFYSGTTLKSFGVAANGTNEFTVTEADIKKNTPIPALFLNLYANIGSQFFSPMVQLGIDPTKKHPFFLGGGGFAIPAGRIAFSGGAIWTWNASLKSLKVGGPVESSTALEKDIQYEFDAKPKGWYLGIQYNF